MAFARSSSAQARPPISALRWPVSINRRTIASWAFSSAVACQIARSSSIESTRSREVSSPLTVPITGLWSTSPAFMPQANAADRFARALLAPTGPVERASSSSRADTSRRVTSARWQAVQGRPVALQR